jgi:hypothetical protein
VIFRNRNFWRVLGTLAFIALMGWLSSIHVSRKDLDDEQKEDVATGQIYEQPRSGPLPPFIEGFVTACMVGAYWYLSEAIKRPKQRGPDED